MALTAMHRLLRRCRVRPAEVGVVYFSSGLLDRSKSTKTELMAVIEGHACADVEGTDHYGASESGTSAMLSCMSWVQSESWDGRWAVVVCSNDHVVAPFGFLLSSAVAAATLVGRGASLQMSDSRACVHERPPL